MGMSIDEAITRYKNNAEHERTHGNLQGCLEFRQLAEWLRKYQKIKEIVDKWNEGIYDDQGLTHTEVMELVSDEVYEDGNADYYG